MPCFVDPERADEHEAVQRLADAASKSAKPLDIHLAILIDRSPVADLCGAVRDDVDACDSRRHGYRIGEIAANNRRRAFEEGCIRAGRPVRERCRRD